jgi:hypothetical protein
MGALGLFMRTSSAFRRCLHIFGTAAATFMSLKRRPIPATSGKDADPSVQNPASRRYTAVETAALGAAADRRALAQQRKWDRRLQEISGSICDGCSPT